jgi:hypothetical protein
MTDTPQHIKDLQLKIWLSKSPMERLKRTLEDNGALLQFWSTAKVIKNGTSPVSKPDTPPIHIKS